MPYDPSGRTGWAKGLIHFHTKFSDGWASVLRAGEIAVGHGCDFLIVTDHLRNLKLFTKKTLDEYIEACDRARQRLGIPIVPGGEMEVHWNSARTSDFSEAHTLALSIRPLVAAGEFDWTTPGTDPFADWTDTEGNRGTLLAIQEKLRQYNLPPLASHQFQHSPISRKPGGHSDFRYDLGRLATSRYFDFFYSGAIDLIHEMEDFALVSRYAHLGPESLKAVYASCDFHVGPQTTWPPIAKIIDNFEPARNFYRWLFRRVTSIALRMKGDAEAAVFPYFAEEQLSHATYVYLGDSRCTEGSVLEALRDGRTCIARGHAEFANLEPYPSLSRINSSPVHIHLHLPVSYSEPRPRSAVMLRDGEVVHWEPYSIAEPSLQFTYIDRNPPPGQHCYQLYVPSKFLSSPILFAG